MSLRERVENFKELQEGVKGLSFSGLKFQVRLRPGLVLCLRQSGNVFDVADDVDGAMRIIEPMARANRGEEFYTAVVTATITEPLPPLRIEALDTPSQTVASTADVNSTYDEIRSSQYRPGTSQARC